MEKYAGNVQVMTSIILTVVIFSHTIFMCMGLSGI